MNKENKIPRLIIMIAMLVITVGASRNLINQQWETVILECTVGQDLTVRETNGTATFLVTFQDGEFVSATCTIASPATE